MAKSKKVLSLALAVVMLIGMLSIGVFAAKTTPTASISVTSSTSDAIQKGDTVTITVAATANEDYFVGPTAVPVTYDATLFEASDVVVSDLFGADTTEKVANTTKAGTVTVVITPKTAGEPVAPNLNGQNVVLYTFTLTAIADAGSCDVAVVDDQKTATNLTGKLYITSFDGADAREAELTTVGQTLVLDNASVNVVIGSAATPEIVAIAGTTGYVDTEKMYVYGVPAGESVLDYFEAVNGTLEQVSNGKTVNGTGATLLLKDASGNTVATYTVIIFGDVDGSGTISSDDYLAVKAATMTTPLEGAYAFAGDVDASGSITSDDYLAVKAATMTTPLDPDPYH